MDEYDVDGNHLANAMAMAFLGGAFLSSGVGMLISPTISMASVALFAGLWAVFTSRRD